MALSITDRIESFGAYAGFAAILGLAVLAVLYFAQSREMQRLREWAEDAPERARELESILNAGRVPVKAVKQQSPEGSPGVEQQSDQAVVEGSTQVDGTQVSEQPVEGDQQHTQVINASEVQKAVEESSDQAASEESESSEEDKQQDEADAVGQDTQQIPQVSADPELDPHIAQQPVKPPVTPAAVSRASSLAQPTVKKKTPAPRPTGGAVSKQQMAAYREPRSQASRQATKSGVALSTSTTRIKPVSSEVSGSVKRSTSRSKVLVAILSALAVVGIGLLVVTQLLGGGDSKREPNRAEPVTTTSKSSSTSASVPRDEVTVSVLNGTTVAGLAAQLADEVEGAGFIRGPVTNAADQQRSATVVYYDRGFRASADEVAKLLNISQVEPLDEGTKVIAGDSANVVVTVGSDRTS